MSLYLLVFLLGMAALAALVSMAVLIERRHGSARHRSTSQQATPRLVQGFFAEAQRSPFDALAHLRAGDVTGARIAMNKLAYLLHGDPAATGAQHAQFRRLLGLFGEIDPMVLNALTSLHAMLEQTPGMLQSKLYARLGLEAEAGRYVLTCAEAMGKVVRRRKGSSYQVFLPHQNMDEAPPPKRRRVKRESAVAEQEGQRELQ